MPPLYVDPWVLFALTLLALYAIERIFVDLVRVVDRRTRAKRKKPDPPSPIILP